MFPPGTEVTMLNEVPEAERLIQLESEGLDTDDLGNVDIVHRFGNIAVKRTLENLPIETFTAAMVLAEQHLEGNMMDSDSHTLAALLMLRDVQKQRQEEMELTLQEETGMLSGSQQNSDDGESSDEDNVVRPSFKRKSTLSQLISRNASLTSLMTSKTMQDNVIKKCPVVCEILDPRTQKAVTEHRSLGLTSDFVVSNRLISKVLAMLSEDRKVKRVLDELLSAKGQQMQVKSSSLYANDGDLVPFCSLQQRALELGHVLCGYQLQGSLDTVMNPKDKVCSLRVCCLCHVFSLRGALTPLSRQLVPKDWADYDLVVMCAERGYESERGYAEGRGNNRRSSINGGGTKKKRQRPR